MRVKRGREWVTLSSATDPYRAYPPDGLDEYRLERTRSLTRERVRRFRERQKAASQSYENKGAAVQ